MNLIALYEIILPFLVFAIIISLAWLVFYLIGMYKFFEKAGQAGWKGLIPYYNTYVMGADMAGLKWYWPAIAIGGSVIGSCIPYIGFLFSLVGMLASVNIYYNLQKKLNQRTSWFVLTIFFSGITLPLLGYLSNTTWNQAAPVDPDGFMSSVLSKNQNTGAQNMNQASAQNAQQPVQNADQSNQNPQNNNMQ